MQGDRRKFRVMASRIDMTHQLEHDALDWVLIFVVWEKYYDTKFGSCRLKLFISPFRLTIWFSIDFM